MLNAMTANLLNAFLAMAPAGNGQPSGPWYLQMFPVFLLLFAFYFALWRPQQKRARKHEDLLKTLRAGDKVTTTSGIVGVIVTVKERSVSLRSADSKLEVLKTAISEVLERDQREAEGVAAQT